MKPFWKAVMQWKTSTCHLYTAAMVIYLFFCTVFRNHQVSLIFLWSLLAMSVASTLIQGLCFSDRIIRKMRYTWRSLLFVLLYLPLLSIVAWKAEWFPVTEPGAWMMFLGMFFIIFIAMTIGFDIYFRTIGAKYDGMLGRYRKEKEEKGE